MSRVEHIAIRNPVFHGKSSTSTYSINDWNTVFLHCQVVVSCRWSRISPGWPQKPNVPQPLSSQVQCNGCPTSVRSVSLRGFRTLHHIAILYQYIYISIISPKLVGCEELGHIPTTFIKKCGHDPNTISINMNMIFMGRTAGLLFD